MTLEKVLESKCVRYAQKKRWLVYKLGFEGRRGAPDRLFISQRGHVLFVEFKSATGRLSKLQKHTIEKIRAHNISCVICSDFDEFKKTLERFN